MILKINHRQNVKYFCLFEKKTAGITLYTNTVQHHMTTLTMHFNVTKKYLTIVEFVFTSPLDARV